MIKNYFAIEEKYGEPVKKLFKKEEYDERSLLVKVSDFQYEDVLITEYKYNSDGYNTETSEFSNGENVSKHVTEYNQKNREIRSRTYNGTDLISETIKTYDEDQLICTIVKTDESISTEKFIRIDKNSFKWEFWCDDRFLSCQITQSDFIENSETTSIFNEFNTLEEIIYTKFDETGREIYTEHRSPDGSVLKKIEYEYENDLIIRHMEGDYTFKFSERTILYEYDVSGNLIKKETRNTDGNLEQIVLWSYDSSGNITEAKGKTEDSDDAFGYIRSDDFHLTIETIY